MTEPTEGRRPQLIHGAAGLALAAIWGLFAYRHINVFGQTGEWRYLVFCMSETLQAALFVLRYRPVSVSNNPVDWAVAVAGTVAPLFFVPHESGFGPLPGALIVMGALMQMLGLFSLNRSFAIVAARRKIKTSGMYRVVRHPIYASYLVLFSGYVWANATLWNISLFSVIVGCIVARIVREERHLRADSTYREYTTQVRYRLVPFLF